LLVYALAHLKQGRQTETVSHFVVSDSVNGTHHQVPLVLKNYGAESLWPATHQSDLVSTFSEQRAGSRNACLMGAPC
jgi:hypothetical protein